MERKERTVKLYRDLKPYLHAYRRPYFAGAIAIALSTGFMIAKPRLVQKALDSLGKGVDEEVLFWCAAGIVGVALGRAFFLFFARRFMIFASRRIENDIRNDFFRHLQTLSPGFYHKNPTGDLMAVATNDLNAIRQVIGPGIMYSVSTVFSSIFIVINLFLISPLLTVLAMAVLPLMAFAVFRFGKAIHWRFEKIQAQFGTLTSRTQENLAGVRLIRSYGREKHEEEVFKGINREYVRRNKGYVIIQSAFRPVLGLVMGLGTLIMIFVGGEMIIAKQITIGAFTAFSIYLGMLIWPAIAIGWITGMFQRGAASMKRLQRILDTVPIIRDEEGAAALEETAGSITIENLNFRYTPTGPLVLRDISVAVQPGEKVALIGETGSGKTTLVHLLARLYPVERNRIRIAGKDINDISLRSLRTLFGFVPQETFLFSDTIRNNIAFARPDAGMEEIKSAAGLAALKEEIEAFPNQYDTLLGERGINLSGGQKQRTAIARAVLKNPRILILDDALSSVDTHTEERLLRGIETVSQGRTLIIIAHRISTVRNADRILVMHEGRIVEEGTHENLIQRGGRYAALEEQQRLETEIEEM